MAEIGMENKEKRRSDRCNGATRSRPEKEGRVVIMVLAHRKHGFEGGVGVGGCYSKLVIRINV